MESLVRLRQNFFAALLLIISSISFADAPDLDIGLRLDGRWVEESFHRSQLGGTRVQARFRHWLGTTFKTTVRSSVTVETGAYESAFIEEYGPQQAIRIEQATVSWFPLEETSLAPIEEIGISVGVLDHDTFGGPILVHDKSFAGLRERIRFGFGDFYVRLEAEQSLASSPSRTIFPNFGHKKAPLFLMEQGAIGFDTGSFFAEAHVSHFSFMDVAPEVEYRSRFFGNTATGFARENARLSYTFHGIEFGSKVAGRLGNFSPAVSVNGVQNMDPPSGKNMAGVVGLQLDYAFSPNFVLGLEGTGLYIESDVTPGFYSNRFFGHNNRKGFGLGLSLGFPKSETSVLLGYTNTRTIDDNAFQANFQQANIQFETFYDLL